MAPYIYTSRNGVHIIDLVQTAQLMDDAYNYMRSSAEQGKKFSSSAPSGKQRDCSARSRPMWAYYINQRWLGGMLTNWTTIKTRVDRLKELEHREETGALDLLPKKEASMLRREMGNSKIPRRHQNDA
jgi:small subunit ribosomal protein S2